MIKFLKDEKGQGLSEYALIIGLVAIVAIGGLLTFGNAIQDKFYDINCSIEGGSWASADANRETGECIFPVN